MIPAKIRLTLQSAATFGRGDGVVGLVDREIEHDAYGFPYLRGKTLKGLLVESAENVVFALQTLQGQSRWEDTKARLFGSLGAKGQARGSLHVGDAELSVDLRAEVLHAGWSPTEILDSLTGIRRQTAVNPYGAPDDATLRSMRVLLPGVTLEAPLSFEQPPSEAELQLLAAAVLDLRHAGTGRNRGRGWLKAELDSDADTRRLFDDFEAAIKREGVK